MTAKPRFELKRDALRVPIDLKTLGPAMRKLPSDRWRAAAVARFMVKSGRGGGNAAACRVAGFASTTPASMKSTAHRVFHDARMLAALDELGKEFLRGGVPDAIAVVYEIMGDKKHKDRLKAAMGIINYAHPLQTAHHAGTYNTNRKTSSPPLKRANVLILYQHIRSFISRSPNWPPTSDPGGASANICLLVPFRVPAQGTRLARRQFVIFITGSK